MPHTQTHTNAPTSWQTPSELSVSDWADTYRQLSLESSAEPGQWQTDRAPYQRGMLDAMNEVGTHTVVIQSSSQIGKTEIINNIVGYYIDQDPAPMLLVQPTLAMAQSWSKDRLAPMLRDTPKLKGVVKAARTRDSGNTLLHKQFPGGHLAMGGANSAANLASRPIRIVLCDEVDRYPHSAGTEGDPVSLAIKRTNNFWNRKIILVSTPTIKGSSRIEKAYLSSDQRRYFVPCPHCDEHQTLVFSQLRTFEKEVVYQCQHCGKNIHHSHKQAMLAQGHWQAQSQSDGIAGFHLNELYSPWRSWQQVYLEYQKVKDDPQRFQTFVNTALGETWEQQGDSVGYKHLFQRREKLGNIIPTNACVLTAAVDVQKDRLELQLDAWGQGFERWVMDYQVFLGSPAENSVWQQLQDYLQQRWQHASGNELPIAMTLIDSGGHFTTEVYRFAKQHQHRRVYACKGSSVAGSPIVSLPKRTKHTNALLYRIGTDTAKELIYARLTLNNPGPGYMHFNQTLGLEYFKQLTSEHVVNRADGKRLWQLKSGRRNEALDVSVYSLAAVEALRPDFEYLLTQLNDTTQPEKATAESSDDNTQILNQQRPSRGPRQRARQQSGFIHSWRTY